MRLVLVFAAMAMALLWPSWWDGSVLPLNFGDLPYYHYPMRHLAFSTMQQGRMPFWNPYIFAGLPLAANPQSVLFYPVSTLGLVFPLALSFSWDYLFHLIWAALGMMLLGRRSGLGRWGSWTTACLYALSPFLVYRISEGIPTLLASLSWVPWCWLAWGSGLPGLLGAVWALQLFSGHPQFLAINAIGMLVWAAASRRSAPLLGLLREGSMTLGLAAIQWALTREFAAQSLRSGWPAQFTSAYSIELETLWTWLRPDALGNPLRGDYAGPPSVFFETTGVFIGALALCMALWGLRRQPGACVLLGLGLFLAAGGHNPAYRLLISGTPLGFFRTPSRYLLLALWALVIGFGCFWRRRQNWRAPRLPAAALLVALIAPLAFRARAFVAPRPAEPDLRTNKALAGLVSGKPFRLITDPEITNPNKTLLYRALNVNGYEAFYLKGFPSYAARSEGRPAADPSRAYVRRQDTQLMSRLGVSWRLGAAGELEPNPRALPLAYFVDERGNVLEERPSLRMDRPERWTISGDKPGRAARLIIAQPHYPGWRAWADGQALRLETWDGFLQSLPLEGHGVTRIRLVFSPTGWPLWSALSILSWTAWLVFMLKKVLIS
ncbi:MAG: hypothetical protein HY549_06465 [Elusimicrobia bacterium]|nr:hypothetical protein [Elusimicrobiota bacterium]